MIGGYSTLTPVRPLVLVSPILHYKENVQFLDAFISTLTRQLQNSNAVLSSSWSFLGFTALHHTGLPPPPPDPTMSVNSCSGFEHILWPRIDFTDHRNSVKNGTSLTHRTVFRGSNRKHEGSVVSPSLALLSPSSLISSQGVPTLLEEELKQRNDEREKIEARQNYHSQEFCSCTCKVQRLPSARLQFGT